MLLRLYLAKRTSSCTYTTPNKKKFTRVQRSSISQFSSRFMHIALIQTYNYNFAANFKCAILRGTMKCTVVINQRHRIDKT